MVTILWLIMLYFGCVWVSKTLEALQTIVLAERREIHAIVELWFIASPTKYEWLCIRHTHTLTQIYRLSYVYIRNKWLLGKGYRILNCNIR